MFEQLTDAPLEAPSDGSELRFHHAVSGSLRVLSLYRIVAVSAANVEADFASGSLVPVAVPNTSPPPRPLLYVTPKQPSNGGAPYQAELQVRVPHGLVEPIEYRLRRSRLNAAATVSMPIVATGAIPADETPYAFHIIDTGTSQIEPNGSLRPWACYTWCVEVRGAPEAGGGPTAEWSAASLPVPLTFVPPDPPAAPTDLSVTRGQNGAATVVWKHPDALVGGTTGNYTCELYRRIDPAPEQLVAAIDTEATAADGGRDQTGTFRWTEPADPGPPEHAVYRVVVVDPLGRRSPPTGVEA
jgi:hypothetical protein